MKNLLKVWLVKNELTPDPNDFMASISTVGSIGFDDIIDEMVAEGTEHKRETLVDIARRFQRTSSRLVLNGYNVNTGQIYMRPIVSGAFYGKNFDPAKNNVYVSINQSADLRKSATETRVEVLGEKADLMVIYQVINMVTKQTDGTLPKGRNVRIEGSYIKIAGDFPGIGVYLDNIDTATENKLDAEYIVTNDPSKLIILVPDTLPEGFYKLRIITQYSPQSSSKKIREVVFDQILQLS